MARTERVASKMFLLLGDTVVGGTTGVHRLSKLNELNQLNGLNGWIRATSCMAERMRLFRCVGLRETPVDVWVFAGMNTGNAEGIEGGGAIVEEEDVGAGVLTVAGVDAFVFAVVNPPAVENDRHAGLERRLAEFVGGGAPRAIHGNAREGPVIGPGGGAVDAVPAINVEGVAGLFRRRWPGFRTLRVVPAGGVEAIDAGQPGRTVEDIIAYFDGIERGRRLGREVFPFVKDRGPTGAILGAVLNVILRRHKVAGMVVRVHGDA